MGQIIGGRRMANDKMKWALSLDLKEILTLQGHTDGIHIFSSDNCKEKASIMETGIKKGAKYFVVPQKFVLKPPKKRKNKFSEYFQGSCQRLDIQNKVFFIYTIKKFEGGHFHGY